MNKPDPDASLEAKVDTALRAQQQEEREESEADFTRLTQSIDRIADALARDRGNDGPVDTP